MFVCSQFWQGLPASVENGGEGTCLRPDPHEFRTISTEFGGFRWPCRRTLGFGTLTTCPKGSARSLLGWFAIGFGSRGRQGGGDGACGGVVVNKKETTVSM